MSRNELSTALPVKGDGNGDREVAPGASLVLALVLLLESDEVWKLSWRNIGCDDRGGASCGSGRDRLNWCCRLVRPLGRDCPPRGETGGGEGNPRKSEYSELARLCLECWLRGREGSGGVSRFAEDVARRRAPVISAAEIAAVVLLAI